MTSVNIHAGKSGTNIATVPIIHPSLRGRNDCSNLLNMPKYLRDCHVALAPRNDSSCEYFIYGF